MELHGIIPANIMPFTADGEIDADQYCAHIGWLAAAPGVTAVTCNGHAAEVSSLSRDERRRAIALAAEVINGRLPLIAGVYAENYRQAITSARDAVAEGADALLILPINALSYGLSADAPVTHFKEIASAVDLPLIAFIYPQSTAMQYDLPTLLRILEIPSVVAVKEWSLDIRAYEMHWNALQQLGRHVALLSSFSTNLLPSLVVGADGILSGHGSIIADLQAALFASVQKQDLDDAKKIYRRIQILTRSVYRPPMADMYARMKAQLVMLGRLRTSFSRPPISRIAEEEMDRLRQALDAAGLTA